MTAKKCSILAYVFFGLTIIVATIVGVSYYNDETTRNIAIIITILVGTFIGTYFQQKGKKIVQDEIDAEEEKKKQEFKKQVKARMKISNVYKVMYNLVTDSEKTIKQLLEQNALKVLYEEKDRKYYLSISSKKRKKQYFLLLSSDDILYINDESEISINKLSYNEIINLIVDDINKYYLI